MFLRQHARGQGLGSVVRQQGHHRLVQDRPMVQLGRHQVDAGTGEPATHVDGALVGVKAGKRRQQGRVDVDEPPLVMLHESRRQDPHEPRQHHQRRLVPVDHGGKIGFERFATVESLVIDDLGGNVMLTGNRQPAGVRPDPEPPADA